MPLTPIGKEAESLFIRIMRDEIIELQDRAETLKNAEIFDAEAADMSNMKKSTSYQRVPARVWEAMRAWYYSELPLRGYKPLEKIVEPVTEPDTTDIATMLPVVKAETKAKTIRKEFEKSKKIISKEEISIRTGHKLIIEWYEDKYIPILPR